MFILACGDYVDKFQEFTWLGESTDVLDLEGLKLTCKKSKLLKNKIFIIFNLKDYTDNRVNSLENKFNYGVEMKGE